MAISISIAISDEAVNIFYSNFLANKQKPTKNGLTVKGFLSFSTQSHKNVTSYLIYLNELNAEHLLPF